MTNSRNRRLRFKNVGLSALSNVFANFSSDLVVDLALQNGRDFWWTFRCLRCPGNKTQKLSKTLEKIRSNIRVKNSNSGTFRSAPFRPRKQPIHEGKWGALRPWCWQAFAIQLAPSWAVFRLACHGGKRSLRKGAHSSRRLLQKVAPKTLSYHPPRHHYGNTSFQSLHKHLVRQCAHQHDFRINWDPYLQFWVYLQHL